MNVETVGKAKLARGCSASKCGALPRTGFLNRRGFKGLRSKD